MRFEDIDRELGELEFSISPDLRSKAAQLMNTSYEPLKADKELLLEVWTEIKDAEAAVAQLEPRLSVFPQYRRTMEDELGNREFRSEVLKTELKILQDTGELGKRRWDYAILSQRIEAAQEFAKVCMGVMGRGNKAAMGNKLKALKGLRTLVDEEYVDVKFVRVVPASEKITVGPEPAPQRQLLLAPKYPGLESVNSLNMPEEVRAIFEERRYGAVWAYPKKLMGEIFVGDEFSANLYLFNWNTGRELKTTVRIDSDHFQLDAPKKSRTFRFPRYADSVRYSTNVKVAKPNIEDWISAEDAAKGNGKYAVDSGFFLPGRISACIRMDIEVPEIKSHLYLPILKESSSRQGSTIGKRLATAADSKRSEI